MRNLILQLESQLARMELFLLPTRKTTPSGKSVVTVMSRRSPELQAWLEAPMALERMLSLTRHKELPLMARDPFTLPTQEIRRFAKSACWARSAHLLVSRVIRIHSMASARMPSSTIRKRWRLIVPDKSTLPTHGITPSEKLRLTRVSRPWRVALVMRGAWMGRRTGRDSLALLGLQSTTMALFL